VQRHDADAIALHHPRHHGCQTRSLNARARVAAARPDLVDHRVEPSGQPHRQAVGGCQLMPQQRSQRTADRGRLRRCGSELGDADVLRQI
jgi:hypothetical protein